MKAKQQPSWSAEEGFTTVPANPSTTAQPIDLDKLLAIGREFRQQTSEQVVVSRQSFANHPCSLCGHVTQISDDGNDITVCPCVYHELLKLPTADNPSSSTPLSGGIRIFVVNTDKAPCKVLDFQP